ncbi:hypothetical protein P7K49_040270 [Saguinus oedipus]|uniref:Uncharacterized protein n=1 Tax=Saguinus oedipus TaxID=9490 RepID=A0ABQ9T8T4_SAGOE|nr:hypothetical protein P7K49_040270 [Saguinus oedipus]
MVIAFTSEFIPRVVYKYRYSPCLKEANSTVDCLTGYVNHSLSVFYTKDFQNPEGIEGSENVTHCRSGTPLPPRMPSELLNPDLRYPLSQVQGLPPSPPLHPHQEVLVPPGHPPGLRHPL